MNKSIEEEIKSIAQRVVSMAIVNADKVDAGDNPYFLSYEVLDLAEWICTDHSMNRFVIKNILKSEQLSNKAKQIIRELS